MNNQNAPSIGHRVNHKVYYLTKILLCKSILLVLLGQPSVCTSKSSPFLAENNKYGPSRKLSTQTTAFAAPSRLDENADGVLYVNNQCISCSSCKMLAPETFDYSPKHQKYIVSNQPSTTSSSSSSSSLSENQIDMARAAMAACPVSAIRVENSAQRNHIGKSKLSMKEEEIAKQFIMSPKLNQRPLPFPRSIPGLESYGVYHLGHHNSASFGAIPYLIQTTKKKDNTSNEKLSVMVDTPKFSKSAIKTIVSLTGEKGPDYLIITHVDDSADHLKWKEFFPSLKRIFHEGDLGVHNWIGDETLEDVEILLKGETNPTMDVDDDDDFFYGWKAWTLEGDDLVSSNDRNEITSQFAILHTPGHSPGSISLLWKGVSNDNVVEDGTDSKHMLFTGDTYAFSARENSMTGFPRYGNDLNLQAQILKKMLRLPRFDAILPGHGLHRIYSSNEKSVKKEDIEEAAKKLISFY